MTKIELDKYILIFSEAYVELSNKLSLAINNNSCLRENIALKAFIMRNYIRILRNVKLVPDTLNYEAYYINDIIYDDSIVNNEITIKVKYNSNQFKYILTKNISGIELAAQIASDISTINNSFAASTSNYLSIFDISTINLKIAVSDNSGQISYNLITADKSHAELEYYNKYNTFKYSDILEIISATEMMIKTKCKCN